MPKFYVTFGQKYRNDPHPKFEAAHPDGVVEIEAPDGDSARLMAHEALGPYWSGIYDEEHYRDTSHYYPRGIIRRLP